VNLLGRKTRKGKCNKANKKQIFWNNYCFKKGQYYNKKLNPEYKSHADYVGFLYEKFERAR